MLDECNEKVTKCPSISWARKGGCDVCIIIGTSTEMFSIAFSITIYHFSPPFSTGDNDKTQASGSARDVEVQLSSSLVVVAPEFPFPAGEDDHCESPLEAYRDIGPLLEWICGKHRQHNLSSACIYDPYYCNGAVIRHLQLLGFSNVYNRNEDCYQVWSDPTTNKYPSFEIFVTNPPYSGDHIEKLIQHVTSLAFGTKPWFLLLPNWVHKKDYYLSATANIRPFYLVPKKRYVYVPPKHFRQSKKSSVHKKSSPFVSMWYIYGGNERKNEQLVQHFLGKEHAATCDLARSKSALRDLRRKNP
jgi:hypothetical protein